MASVGGFAFDFLFYLHMLIFMLAGFSLFNNIFLKVSHAVLSISRIENSEVSYKGCCVHVYHLN